MPSSPVHEDVATALVGFLDPIALLAVSMFSPDDWFAVQEAIKEVVTKISTRVEEAPLQSLSWDIPGVSDPLPTESLVFSGPMRHNERKFLRLVGKQYLSDTSGDVEVPTSSYGYAEGTANFTVSAYKSGDVSIPAWVVLCADGEDDVVSWIHNHEDESDISGSLDWEDYPENISWYGKRVDDDSYRSDDYIEVNIEDFDVLVEDARGWYDLEGGGWEDEDEDEI